MPVTLGVLLGATLGARVLVVAQPALLRAVFCALIAFLGAQMIYRGFSGGEL
jgi:uncharacterized membrane protein YfcA